MYARVHTFVRVRAYPPLHASRGLAESASEQKPSQQATSHQQPGQIRCLSLAFVLITLQ